MVSEWRLKFLCLVNFVVIELMMIEMVWLLWIVCMLRFLVVFMVSLNCFLVV